MEQNSEHFSPLRNGSERDSENFLFHGTAGIPPEKTNCSVYSVFRGIIFLSEIANPRLYSKEGERLEELSREVGKMEEGACRKEGGR